ncbi:MAG: hypothetical protein MZW92_00580 [Comamonadaceae bacterium]|nr:hypothetical protein [Comamonadaceae bacterium]
MGGQRFMSTLLHRRRAVGMSASRPCFIALEGGGEGRPPTARTSGAIPGRYTYAHGAPHRRCGRRVRRRRLRRHRDRPTCRTSAGPNRLADDFEAVHDQRHAARSSVHLPARPISGRRSPAARRDARPTCCPPAPPARPGCRQTGVSARQRAARLGVAGAGPGRSARPRRIAEKPALLAGSALARLVELGALWRCWSPPWCCWLGGWLVRRQVREMAGDGTRTGWPPAAPNLAGRVRDSPTTELAGQKDAADRASRAKGRFLAAAGHDLRQPMHALVAVRRRPAAPGPRRRRRARADRGWPSEQIATSISGARRTARLAARHLAPRRRRGQAGDPQAFPLNPDVRAPRRHRTERAAVDRNLALHLPPANRIRRGPTRTRWMVELHGRQSAVQRACATPRRPAAASWSPRGAAAARCCIEVRDSGAGHRPGEHRRGGDLRRVLPGRQSGPRAGQRASASGCR